MSPRPPGDQPPAAHDPHDPRTWDLSGAVIDGNDGRWLHLYTEIGRRSGARSIEYGYEPHPITGQDPAPNDPTTWYVTLTLPDRTIRTTSIARPAHGISHTEALLNAGAQMVRELGGHAHLHITK